MSASVLDGNTSHGSSQAGLLTGHSHSSSPPYINEHGEAYKVVNYLPVSFNITEAARDSRNTSCVPPFLDSESEEVHSIATEEPSAQVPQSNIIEPQSYSAVQSRRRTRASTVRER